MRKVTAAIAALALLFPAATVAQDEPPSVTVVPNEQFCNLVADDLEACELALIALASGGLLPKAFAGLMAATPTEDVGLPPTGEPVVFSGTGDKTTKPFELAAGDYVVTYGLSKGYED